MRITLRLIAAAILAGGVLMYGTGGRHRAIVYAQTLPVTKTLAWDANPAAENVTNYTVTLDGTTIGNPTGLTQQVTFTTAGAHTITLTATNMWGTSPATPLVVTVISPTGPRNPRLQ